VELTHESLSIDSMGVVSSVLLCIPLFLGQQFITWCSFAVRGLCIPLTACEHLWYINIECSLLLDPVLRFRVSFPMSRITVDISKGIATIQLNRPGTLNALTPEGMQNPDRIVA